MPRYFYHIKGQTDWPESIVLVQIFGNDESGQQTAVIRSAVGNYVSEMLMEADEALFLAEQFRVNNGLDAIGVHLEEGAQWNPAWGELVDESALGPHPTA